MRVEHISANTYGAIVDDLSSGVETIMLAGTWPVSVGRSEHYGHVMLAHIQDRFILVTLDDAPELTPEEAAQLLTMNPEALQ